jgi:peroxiredoxin
MLGSILTCLQTQASDALSTKWMSQEELKREIFERKIELPKSFFFEFEKYISLLKLEEKENWESLLHDLSQNPDNIELQKLSIVINSNDPRLIGVLEILSDNKDPIAKAGGLIGQIWIADGLNAASELKKIKETESLTKNDIWALDNFMHAIGIDINRDNAQEIYRFLKAARSGKESRLSVGTEAPDFEINTLSGKSIRLSDFKGRIVLLHFWSKFCGPCIAELPNLKEDFQQWRKIDPNFVMIGVILDDDIDLMNELVNENDLDWIHVSDGRGWGSSPAKLYYVAQLPTDIIIDRDGKIASYKKWNLPNILREQELTIRSEQ